MLLVNYIYYEKVVLVTFLSNPLVIETILLLFLFKFLEICQSASTLAFIIKFRQPNISVYIWYTHIYNFEVNGQRNSLFDYI